MHAMSHRTAIAGQIGPHETDSNMQHRPSETSRVLQGDLCNSSLHVATITHRDGALCATNA